MCDVIDSLGMYLKEKTKGKGMVVLNNMIDIDARVIPPRLTNSAGLDFEEQIIVRLVEKKIEEALKSFEDECLLAEQERVAKELEDKRLTEEQALKLFKIKM
jgi:hypothetical protein